MPHNHQWLIENRVFYNEYNGDVSADDLRRMATANLKYLESSDAPLVHCFVNAENLSKMPVNLTALRDSTLPTLQHPRMGWVIAYGTNNPLLSFLGSTVTQLFQTRYRLFDSYERAVEFLQSVDETLPDLSRFDLPSQM